MAYLLENEIDLESLLSKLLENLENGTHGQRRRPTLFKLLDVRGFKFLPSKQFKLLFEQAPVSKIHSSEIMIDILQCGVRKITRNVKSAGSK